MTALEFWARLNPDGTLPVPGDVAAHIQSERPVRVIVVLNDSSDEDRTWTQLTTDQFLNGYDDGDALYDDIQSG